MKKTISIVVPCFNEEESLHAFYNALISAWENINYNLELIFVDDGSKDSTYNIIKELSNSDSRIHFSSFSRNFGKEGAIFCGLRQANGDAVIIMDADLQHPVSVIPLMLKRYEEGFDIVEGKKTNRGNESFIHKAFANVFYWIICKITGFDMANSSDFKLLDRKVVDILSDIKETDTFFRAMSFWVGFSSTTVDYEVAERIAGDSKWSSKSLIKYAISNITAFTNTPLHLILKMGLFIFIIGILLAIDAIVSYFAGESIGGYPSLVVLIVLATSVIMSSLGIIALYLSKMYAELKGRPQYVIKDKQ